MKQPNWIQIKEFLNTDFIEQDFKPCSTFSSIDFDKGLEIFKYILNKKLPNHDETKDVFEGLQLNADTQPTKESFVKLISKFEPFIKKLFEIINIAPNDNSTAPALGWCCNQIFAKQSPQISRQRRNDFFDKTVVDKVEVPNFPPSHFETNFFVDGGVFGKALHRTYHLRNASIHNDTAIGSREISEVNSFCIISYLFFTFKYYNELCSVISDDDLRITESLEIKNLISLSGGAYNPIIKNEVQREGIIQTIETKLKKVNILFLEGGDGVGKTTVLHQFIAKHPNNCFAYFIDSRDKNTYSALAILQAFCNQFYFFQKKEELINELNSSQWLDESYLKRFFHSTKLRNSPNQNLYFIIDGLDEINEESQLEIKEQILDLIPYQRENIKILLTGRISYSIIPEKIKSENWEIPSFSADESKSILGMHISPQDFMQINKICLNNAGKLVFIRELVNNSNITISNIIDNISYNIDDLYTYLWNHFYVKESRLQSLILAIIAFEGKKYSIDIIAKVLTKPDNPITEEQIKEVINKIPFIRRNQRNTYEFIFDDLSIFIRKKLSNYKKIIDDVLIEYLINNSADKEALVNLPEIYRETGKIDDLVKLLGEDKWKQLLQKSESISEVSKVASTALHAVKDYHENKYIPIILKFAILKSALKELNQTSIWQYEIAANLSLGDDINAINLANIAFLKEDRLKLFASITKTYTQKKQEIPYRITKSIQELYEEIDFKSIGNAAVEIASLLMYSNPKLAFQLIEDLSGSVTDNDNAFDWALAQMSLSAYQDLKENEDVSKENVHSKVYSKIRNPKIKEFANAILFLSENQTLSEIITKINELDSTSQKMFLIRNWIINNRNDENITDIVELGINLVIKKSDKYVPKATDFKTFATPLPYIKDKPKSYELIIKIEQHLTSIEFVSSTNDILYTKLLIAQTLCNFDFQAGEEKLSNIYDEINRIPDLALKTTCLAIYANAATKIKNQFPDKDIEIYADSAREEIEKHIDSILNQTADHFEIVQEIITTIVNIFPQTAILISKKLNKSIDRDNAALECLAKYLEQALDKIDIITLDKLLDCIADWDIRTIAIHEILNKLDSVEKPNKIPNKFCKYFEMIDSIIDNESKCTLYITLLSILEKEGESTQNIAVKLKNNWLELERSANKIELGFKIAYQASFLDDKNLAKDFLQMSRREKETPELLLDSPNTAQVYYLSIELVIRLFSGLISKNTNTDEDLNSLEKIISSLPSESQQIKLWTSLVLRIAPKSTDVLPKKIINLFIIPKISKVQNRAERIEIISETLPVFYLMDSALPILDELPSQKLKDLALLSVCKYLLTKCLPEDPCDDNNEGFSIDFVTLQKILALIKRISNDYIIAWQIDNLRKSITSQQSKISSQQIIEIKKQIEAIADEKLPDINNIKHNGYKLLVKSYAISIQRNPKKEEWDEILREVENIPNLSDKIFLWISISGLIQNRYDYGNLKQELIEKASKFSYQLPSFLDTIGRVAMILMTLMSKKVEGINSKNLILQFLDVQKNKDVDPKSKDKYRSMLDAAYSADPNIAKVFVNILDKDSARKNTGAYLNNHLNFLEFETKIEQKLDNSQNEQNLIEHNPKFFNKYIDKRLARLNASKTNTDKLFPKDLIYQLNLASQVTIYESHNAFSYFIERLLLKYENTNESDRMIKKCFLELLEVCNLIKLLSIRNADKIRSLFDIITNESSTCQGDDLTSLKNELGEENYNNVIKLINLGLSHKEINSMLKVDLKYIDSISKNIQL